MTRPPVNFEIHPSSGVPIYRQIIDQVLALVTSGRLKPGDLLPSVRQMAVDLEVNMMTVSKAYARLEVEGVLERDRGTGMRVREQATTARVADRQKELRSLAEHVVTRGLQLGLSDEQILAVVKMILQDRRS
ncbi:MAG: GntR family transcriptional regulator [Planctomycetales bacterium]